MSKIETMNYKLIKKQLIVLFMSMFAFTSCAGWLTIKPDDMVDQGDLTSTPEGVMKALNGVYLDLANNSSYGRDYSCATIEVLAQQYAINPDGMSAHRFHSQYKYTEKAVKGTMDSMWQKPYNQIANLNNLLTDISTKEEMFSPTDIELNYDYIVGECTALRAMLHFDLFRLFGPMYNASTENNLSLPYYTTIKNDANAYVPAKEFLNMVMTDLQTAEKLLVKDINMSKEQFAKYHRNMRLNFFAVKALQARVLLYMGKPTEAYEIASDMVGGGKYHDAVSRLFPFVSPTDINNPQGPDRMFYSELLFCFNNSKRGNIHDDMFSYQLSKDYQYAPRLDAINALFSADEGKNVDYRFLTWKESPGNGKDIEFQKFVNIDDTNLPERTRIQSLVRLGELYLIAAETAPSQDERVNYIEMLRIARGLNFGSVSDSEKSGWDATILSEYRRELYGEGQVFFYYKRKATVSLMSGYAGAGQMFSMGPAQYVVPLPESETNK